MDHFNEIQQFIENARKANNLVELSFIFEKVTKKMGCKYFICASSVDPINPPEHAIVLTNYPSEWVIRHSEKKYFNYDPVFISSLNQIVPFQWSDKRWLSLLNYDQLHILHEANEVGISEGYTVPIHSSQGFPASVSVVFNKGEVSQEALHSIHLMSLYLYEIALHMKINFTKLQQKILTGTQKSVLEEIAKGKSDWAISKLLGRSENTIKYHVKNIFTALGVNSRQQAIVKGLFLGEIRYLDLDASPPNLNTAINICSS